MVSDMAAANSGKGDGLMEITEKEKVADTFSRCWTELRRFHTHVARTGSTPVIAHRSLVFYIANKNGKPGAKGLRMLHPPLL